MTENVPDCPIVTFIASKEKDFPKAELPLPTVLENGAAPADPSFLNAVREKLLASGAEAVGLPSESFDTMNPPRHMLVQVPSIREVGKWFSDYFPDDDRERQKLRVQFVGHSVSGRMSLGASWEPAKENWYKEPFLVLDSTPRALEELGLYTGHVAEVMLAGCYAGQWAANGSPVNGRTLLFTIAEMWHCKVRGADSSVGAEDFDGDGFYAPKGIQPVGWAWPRENRSRQIESDTPGAFAGQPSPTALPPLKALYGSQLEIQAPPLLNELSKYFDSTLPDLAKPKLAIPELEVDLRYHDDDRIEKARFFCNGAFLAVGDGPGKTFYANSNRVGSASVSRLVSRLSTPPRPAAG